MVWPCVRGKSKGFAKRREASMAEDRKEVAMIEQRKKGFPTKNGGRRKMYSV